jgi:hypothetical protein
MRLANVESGHSLPQRAVLALIRHRWGGVPDTQKTFWYRRRLFGRPITRLVHTVTRGPSPWSPGERELFAAFVSSLNQCPF